MPYNEELAERVRKALVQYPAIEEKTRMGGLTFMLNGKLFVRVQDNDLLVRCRPEMTDGLLTKKGAERYTMKGRANMKGWLLVGPEGTQLQDDFDFWMGVTADFFYKSAKP